MRKESGKAANTSLIFPRPQHGTDGRTDGLRDMFCYSQQRRQCLRMCLHTHWKVTRKGERKIEDSGLTWIVGLLDLKTPDSAGNKKPLMKEIVDQVSRSWICPAQQPNSNYGLLSSAAVFEPLLHRIELLLVGSTARRRHHHHGSNRGSSAVKIKQQHQQQQENFNRK